MEASYLALMKHTVCPSNVQRFKFISYENEMSGLANIHFSLIQSLVITTEIEPAFRIAQFLFQDTVATCEHRPSSHLHHLDFFFEGCGRADNW